jgi:hypothetical protein
MNIVPVRGDHADRDTEKRLLNRLHGIKAIVTAVVCGFAVERRPRGGLNLNNILIRISKHDIVRLTCARGYWCRWL